MEIFEKPGGYKIIFEWHLLCRLFFQSNGRLNKTKGTPFNRHYEEKMR
jgi:hypothetical protein